MHDATRARQAPTQWDVRALLACVALGLLTLAHAAAANPSSRDAERPCREIKALVVLVEFPDVKRTIGGRYAQQRLFEDLDEYVREMS